MNQFQQEAPEPYDLDDITQDLIAREQVGEVISDLESVTDSRLQAEKVLGNDRVDDIIECVSVANESLSDKDFAIALVKELNDETDRAEQADQKSDRGIEQAVRQGANPFALVAATEKPTATAKAAEQQDLVGKSESAQGILDKNFARQQKIAAAPPVESVEGDLFSGKAKQIDIENISIDTPEAIYDASLEAFRKESRDFSIVFPTRVGMNRGGRRARFMCCAPIYMILMMINDVYI